MNRAWWHRCALSPRLWRWRLVAAVRVASDDLLIGIERWHDDEHDEAVVYRIGAGPIVVRAHILRVFTPRELAAGRAAYAAEQAPRLVTEVENYLRNHNGPEGTGVAS